MKTLLSAVVVVTVLLAIGVGNVEGKIYTAETAGEGSIGSLASEAGNTYADYTTRGNFTVDGAPLGNVWAAIVSKVDNEYLINGYGWSGGPGDTWFRFTIFGDSENPYVEASLIYFIINDGDSALLEIDGGNLYLGLGDDVVLPQTSVSINGAAWGDISEIVFDYDNRGDHDLDSVAIVTPEPTTMCLLGLGGLILTKRRR